MVFIGGANRTEIGNTHGAAVKIPVLGIGEAAFHAAMLLGHRYCVVTTLSVSLPVIAANLRAYGLASHC